MYWESGDVLSGMMQEVTCNQETAQKRDPRNWLTRAQRAFLRYTTGSLSMWKTVGTEGEVADER